MPINSIKTIYLNSESDLKFFLDDFALNKIHYEQINLKISEDLVRKNIKTKKFLEDLKQINLMSNVYVTMKIRQDHEVINKLINIIPEKIIKLKFRLYDKYNQLKLNALLNLKKVAIKNFDLNQNIIDFLSGLLEDNTNLEELFISTKYSKEQTYYQVFLSTILNSLKTNKNLQSIKINIPNMLEKIETTSYYKYYQEIMDLIASNIYTTDKLLLLHEDLQTDLQELEKTKKFYDGMGEKISIISDAIKDSELKIQVKTVSYHNALQFALNNIQSNKIIAEALYHLASKLQLTDPLEAYKILLPIPVEFTATYKKSNVLMAHILLSIDENDYTKIEYMRNLPHDQITKNQLIVSHLLESGQDRSLLNQILHEYVFNQGLIESQDNPFELVALREEVFSKNSANALFILNAWKKREENLKEIFEQQERPLVDSSKFVYKAR